MLLLDSSVCDLFKWRQFEPAVILLAIGWYLRFSLSYRDVEELLAERELSVDHVTVWSTGRPLCLAPVQKRASQEIHSNAKLPASFTIS